MPHFFPLRRIASGSRGSGVGGGWRKLVSGAHVCFRVDVGTWVGNVYDHGPRCPWPEEAVGCVAPGPRHCKGDPAGLFAGFRPHRHRTPGPRGVPHHFRGLPKGQLAEALHEDDTHHINQIPRVGPLPADVERHAPPQVCFGHGDEDDKEDAAVHSGWQNMH